MLNVQIQTQNCNSVAGEFVSKDPTNLYIEPIKRAQILLSNQTY